MLKVCASAPPQDMTPKDIRLMAAIAVHNRAKDRDHDRGTIRLIGTGADGICKSRSLRGVACSLCSIKHKLFWRIFLLGIVGPTRPGGNATLRFT